MITASGLAFTVGLEAGDWETVDDYSVIWPVGRSFASQLVGEKVGDCYERWDTSFDWSLDRGD